MSKKGVEGSRAGTVAEKWVGVEDFPLTTHYIHLSFVYGKCIQSSYFPQELNGFRKGRCRSTGLRAPTELFNYRGWETAPTM